MGMLQLVAVSGTVGKQVIPAGDNSQVTLEGVTLTPSAANASIKIRDGNASGEVVFYARLSATANSRTFEVCHKFTRGMHVKVLGTNAQAYIDIS